VPRVVNDEAAAFPHTVRDFELFAGGFERLVNPVMDFPFRAEEKFAGRIEIGDPVENPELRVRERLEDRPPHAGFARFEAFGPKPSALAVEIYLANSANLAVPQARQQPEIKQESGAAAGGKVPFSRSLRALAKDIRSSARVLGL
jgi:hypothetical protein